MIEGCHRQSPGLVPAPHQAGVADNVGARMVGVLRQPGNKPNVLTNALVLAKFGPFLMGRVPQEMGQANLVDRVSIDVAVRPRRNARATPADRQAWTQSCVTSVVNVDLDVASRRAQAVRLSTSEQMPWPPIRPWASKRSV